MTIPFNVGVPGVVFVNTRQQITPNFAGVVSGNIGIAASLDQTASTALTAAAVPLAETGLGPELGGFGLLLREAGNVGNVMWGPAYRVELHFKDGKLTGIYRKGQKIADPVALAKDLLSPPGRPRVPSLANYGIPLLANYNSTLQMVGGTSPWSLAATAGGKNQGNGAVAVALDWRQAIAQYGTKYAFQLPAEVQSIVALGPQNNAQAEQAVSSILAVASPDDATALARRLSNHYGLNFGVSSVEIAEGIASAGSLAPRPADYDFVRGVFEGRYRYPADLSPQPSAHFPGS